MSGADGGRLPLVSISQLVDLLTGRIDELVPQLLPMGKRLRGEWKEASTKHGGLGDSLSVCMAGSRAGVWRHFGGNQKGGDLLDLIAYLETGGDKVRAIGWAKQWLGIGTGAAGEGFGPDPAALARARKQREQREQQQANDSQRRSAYAQKLWLSGAQVGPDDAAGRYLARRGIGLLQLGRRPGCLRVGAAVRHESGITAPAMLACMIAASGQQVAVHRTWLTEDGRKAGVDPAKSILGSYAGAHIPLWKGRVASTLRELPEGVLVYISEGIEDGLSVARQLPWARVIAAASLGNMATIWLPPQVREVVLVGQNDPEFMADGRVHPARLAFQRAIEAHAEKGRRVLVSKPPEGIKDFNDWVQLVDLNKQDRAGTA